MTDELQKIEQELAANAEINEAQAERRASHASWQELRARAEKAERHVEELQAKAKAGSCGCSVDAPGEVCLHHSPALVAALERAERAEAVVCDTILIAGSRVAKVEAQNAKLKEALRPFARFGKILGPPSDEGFDILIYEPAGYPDRKIVGDDCRRARDVLAAEVNINETASDLKAVIEALEARVKKAERERDEFLAVLKALVEQTAQYGHDEEIADARAIITKAEKQL